MSQCETGLTNLYQLGKQVRHVFPRIPENAVLPQKQQQGQQHRHNKGQLYAAVNIRFQHKAQVAHDGTVQGGADQGKGNGQGQLP